MRHNIELNADIYLLGKQNGAVWLESGSFKEFMSQPAARRKPNSDVTVYNHTLLFADANVTFSNSSRMSFKQNPIEFVLNTTTLAYDTPAFRAADSSYWLPQLAGEGNVSRQVSAELHL
jgi:hypothetical protein